MPLAVFWIQEALDGNRVCPIGMLNWFIVFALTSLICAVALAAATFFIGRILLIKLADQISDSIAARLRIAAATSQVMFREKFPSADWSVGPRIRCFAEKHGLDADRAKIAFFNKTERMAKLMDSAIPLPVVGGIGIDAVLGVVPVIGDIISAGVGALVIVNGLQYGIPRELVSKMVGNICVDIVAGAFPLVGDLFDVAFKANTRNMALLREHLANSSRVL